jgi:hypothetical protein
MTLFARSNKHTVRVARKLGSQAGIPSFSVLLFVSKSSAVGSFTMKSVLLGFQQSGLLHSETRLIRIGVATK